jgi:hypothetical protein
VECVEGPGTVRIRWRVAATRSDGIATIHGWLRIWATAHEDVWHNGPGPLARYSRPVARRRTDIRPVMHHDLAFVRDSMAAT